LPHSGVGDRAAVEKANPERSQPQLRARSNAHLERRKPRKRAEHQGENFAMLQPCFAPEQEHAGEGQDGIGEGQRCKEARDRGVGINELDPGEREQQNDRGPNTERCRVAQPRGKFAVPGDRTRKARRPLEQCSPRIDGAPEIPDEGGNIGDADPADDPHHGGRNVLVGVLIAEKSGDSGYDKQQQRGELESSHCRGDGDKSSETGGKQVDASMIVRTRGVAHEQADHDECDYNGSSRPEQIK
jgi:hypothetical protein